MSGGEQAPVDQSGFMRPVVVRTLPEPAFLRLFFLAVSSFLLQASMQAPSNTGRVLTGPWAGEHKVVDVSD